MSEETIMSQMREALQWTKEMLYARDEMNSKVHCAPIRLSPITERVIMAIEAHDNFMKVDEDDPTLYCTHCMAKYKRFCDCPPIAENE